MKIALSGLSNAGKTTIFNALTGSNIETTPYPSLDNKVHIGVVKVPDKRIETLSEIFKPKKVTLTTIEYIDAPGFAPGDAEKRKEALDTIKGAEAIVHVVRAFNDEAVVHPIGSIDVLRDISIFDSELIFEDYELVEKRLMNIEENRKKGRKINEHEKRTLLKCREVLEKEKPLRDVHFSEEEMRSISSLQFVSIKPRAILINTGEDDIKSCKVLEEVRGNIGGAPVLSVCGKIEMEISQLEEENRREFLDVMGIDEPAIFRLINLCYGMLDLISFITVGKKEVRAWTVKKGINAKKAAGKIHTDIERGFIRAEVISYDDFISAGNIAAARDAALVRLEGQDYIVKDGDIITFRFHV